MIKVCLRETAGAITTPCVISKSKEKKHKRTLDRSTAREKLGSFLQA